ncbi:MAG: FAD-binding oxidoreductase [Bryobacteraceae bacterium]
MEDASGFHGHAERLLVPHTEDELREALAAGLPLTIVGAGTGLTGGRVAQGGGVLSLEKFTRLEVGQGFAVCGAGVTLQDLQSAARAMGQFYAPDPTEWAASVGGSIATNASGSRSFLYGATRRHVRALRVMFVDGRTVWFRRGEAIDFDVSPVHAPAVRKHSAGYPLTAGMDWVDLFVGSEGTLAIILEAELSLQPLPVDLLTGVVFFAGDSQALAAVDAWRAVAGLRMLEYLDGASLNLLRGRFADTPRAGAAVLFEQEMSSEDAPEFEQWEARLNEAGALVDQSWFAATDADRERFRRFRHALPEAVNDRVRRNGFLKVGSDYAVPVERNGEMLAYYRARLDAEFPQQAVIFGHIGDAHVHVNILPGTQAQFDRAREVMLEFARKAIALGGSIAAEHGLGKRKAHLLELQYKQQEIDAMKAVKRRLDPRWLLGRGTLFAMPVGEC